MGLDSPQGSLWALFFNPVPPPAGKEIKVVWRMTRLGDSTFRVLDAAGMVVPLAWGVRATADRTGTIPATRSAPACRLLGHPVTSSDTRGEFWLEVDA